MKKKRQPTQTPRALAGLGLYGQHRNESNWQFKFTPMISIFKSFSCTANSSEPQLSAFISSNAADITTIPDGGWALISPYGDFPAPNGLYSQVFSRTEADELVKTWNSVTGKAARVFKNLWHGLGPKASAPIWDGHPETDRQRWPVERLLAEVTDLRAAANGLEGRVTWNARGMERRTRGPLYPSPLWWHNPPAGTPPTVHPELLESIGLVPTPNISSVPAWTQNATLASESENPPKEPTESQRPPSATWEPEKQNQNNIMDKKKLIKLLGLADDATDEQIENAISELATTANALQTANAAKTTAESALNEVNTQLSTANAQVSTLTAERDGLQSANTTMVAGVLDLVEARGAITPAERDAYKGKITANAAETLAELKTRKAMNTQNIEINGNRVDLSTANSRADALDQAIAKTMKEGNCTRDEAFAKVQRDPNYTALFAAMSDPTKKNS